MDGVLQGEKMSQTWKGANIALLSESQDALRIKNYWPISLLNNEYKLFTEILAERLKKVLVLYSWRLIWVFAERTTKKHCNVRTVLNIIEYLQYNEKNSSNISGCGESL